MGNAEYMGTAHLSESADASAYLPEFCLAWGVTTMTRKSAMTQDKSKRK